MRGPSSLSWQAVIIFAVAVAGAVSLYLFVPVDDPIRGALITALNGAVGAATVYLLGRRQDHTNARVDQVIEQTNGHAEHPPSGGRHVETRGQEQR